MAIELWKQVVITFGFAGTFWILYVSLWRLYFSPLSKFPGPKLAAWTRWYEFYFDVLKEGGGQYLWEIEKMHRKYGPVVRISPYELHISDPDFYEEIYAGGNRERDKYGWQISSGDSARAMGFTLKHHHHRLRREALNPYFSKANVLRLEDRVTHCVGKLCVRFEGYKASQEPVNLTVAYLALTMDIIATYSFGHSSNMLEKEFSSKWKDTITVIMQNTSVINHFPWLPRLMDNFPTFLAKGLPDLSALTDLKKDIKGQVQRVLAIPAEGTSQTKGHASIFEEIRDSTKLPEEEKTTTRLTDEATILVIAASESPAKTLALIHFYLMNNPLKLSKLRQELKDSMSNSHKIPSLSKLESLPYMSAVVKEGLRLHGGITARSSRVAPNEALQYKEWTIPPGTPVSTSSVFIHRNPEIFPDPLDFKPERWLEKSTAARRLDHYLVAFGKGTRNCIGLNLGSAEIYITLAHVIINFEMELFETDISDIKMVRDWYVPQPKLNSIGIQARILNRAA